MRVLLAILCLLALATSASAEGAWVLVVGGKVRIASFETRSQCMDEAKRNIMKVPGVPGHKPESTDSSWSVLAPRMVGGASEFRYDCLLDTVDPRGPKGK
jgi:hypothetical protein